MNTLDQFTEATTVENTDLLHLKRGTGINSDKKITGANIKALFATAAQGAKVDFLTVTQAVDLDTIEARVNALDAAVVLKGSWDASIGTFPGGGTAQAGDSYIVSVAGTVDSIDFTLNDRIVAITDNASTGTYAANWLKLDYTDVVLSVAGLIGAISAEDLRTAITAAKNNFSFDATPGPGLDSSSGYSPGSIVLDRITDSIWICVDASLGAAIWITLGVTGTNVENAYNSAVSIVSQVEAEEGTVTETRRWTPERVAQAIAALIPASAVLDAHNVYTKAQGSAITTLTDAASVTWDMAPSNVYLLTTTTDRAIAAPSNAVAGYTYLLIHKGGHTLTFDPVFKFAGGTAPTGSGGTDIYTFIAETTSVFHGSRGIADSQ